MSAGKNQPTVMFYVQHLLGVGHVFRAVRVAKALAAAGCETHVVWGGSKLPSMDFGEAKAHFLNAVHVGDENFKDLLLDDGSIITEAQKQERAEHLLNLYDSIRPDIVITEAYPFGRRQMRFELLPLLDAINASKPRPMLATSIRDILQENRAPKRVRESLDLVHEHFDLVLVHGDPQIVPIEETLEHADEIMDKVRYSGLVTPQAVDQGNVPSIKTDVLISVGGGTVGRDLMNAAVDAMSLCKAYPDNWCITTGPGCPDDEFDALEARAPRGMQVVRFIADFTAVMNAANVSVSRAGYNTTGDVLRSDCPAILVPFHEGLETEQLRRARMLDALGLITMLPADQLNAENLAATIDSVAAKKPVNIGIKMDGANESARILIDTWKNRQT